MSRKHQRTLEAIFKEPVQSGVAWKDVENLLKTLYPKPTFEVVWV